jgi:hypothetical protein
MASDIGDAAALFDVAARWRRQAALAIEEKVVTLHGDLAAAVLAIRDHTQEI